MCFHRFLFILLGPKGKAKSYHEIGRAIATLMSDEVGAFMIRFLKVPSSRMSILLYSINILHEIGSPGFHFTSNHFLKQIWS